MTWPDWPMKLRTSSSHEEGVDRDWSVLTKEVVGEDGRVTGLKCVRADWSQGKLSEVPDSEFVIPADLILLAMGFTGPRKAGMIAQSGVRLSDRSPSPSTLRSLRDRARRRLRRPSPRARARPASRRDKAARL